MLGRVMSYVIANEHTLLRLSVNMNVFCGWFYVVVRAMKRPYNYACRMFGRLGRLSTQRSSFGLRNAIL